ncbi:Uncharacterized protein Rs2_31163 [Raphanus sativus]|nr:Uncharacterized protein Rs2_31163 [Raphanus sativus]
MDSDAGSSLARRRHRPFSLFLFCSSSFVSFVDFLQVCLCFLGFLCSSFVHGCVSCRSFHIQTSWLLFLTCSPAPSVTAALVSDLAFEGCVCTALSCSLKTSVRGFQGSFARSTSLGCSELYSSSSEANQLLSEDLKANHLYLSLPFTVAKSGACSPFHSRTDSADTWLNFGFINTHCLRYGNIGGQSLLLITVFTIPPNPVKLVCCYAGVKVAQASPSGSFALHHQLFSEALSPKALTHMSRVCQLKLASLNSSQYSVSSPNLRLLKLPSSCPLKFSFADNFIKTSSRQGRERSSSSSSFSQERIFPPQSLFLRGLFGTGRCNDPHSFESRSLGWCCDVTCYCD